MRPKEFKAKGTQKHVMGRKANDNPLIFAHVGDDAGTVNVVGRANFYWICLLDDDSRLTQCYSLVPLANNDLIFVRKAKDRKLTYYEFVEFIQNTGTGSTDPPVQDHDHSGAGEGGQLDWDDIWTDAIHDHSAAGEGGQLDWDNVWTDAVHDHSAAGEGGQNLHQIQELEFDDATTLTIAGGTVTRTQVYHIIASGTDAADNLDQIDGGAQGDLLIIRPDTGDTITVRHNQGGAGDNIWLAGGADIVLDNDDHLMLVYDGTWWCDQSGGAGGVGLHDHSGLPEGDDLNPETISPQTFLVGPAPCPYTTVGAAIAAVNAAGPPASGTEYAIEVMAGTYTEAAGDITIPAYCTVKGRGIDKTIIVGDNNVILSSNSSLQNLTVESTEYGVTIVNGATDFLVWNVLSRRTAGAGGTCYYVPPAYNASGIFCHCRAEAVGTASNVNGWQIGSTSDCTLIDCQAGDCQAGAGGLIQGIYIIGTARTYYCIFQGTTSDVAVHSNGTWVHFHCQSERNNLDTTAIESQFTHWPNGLYLNLDFTGTDWDTKGECNMVGMRFSDEAGIPFPTSFIVANSGTWAHAVGVGWRPTIAAADEGAGILIPLCRAANWELDFTVNYNPGNVNDRVAVYFGYIASSNHVGAYGQIADTGGATQLIASLYTNDGDDTFTSRYAGAALVGAASRTYKFRCLHGCVSVWDDQDDAWHDYEGRQNVGHAYTAAYAFLQWRKDSTWTLAQCDLESLRLTYLL